MTRKAQIKAGVATELLAFGEFIGLDGRAMPPNWLANASPAELEAEAIYDIVETTPPPFPQKIGSTALEITSGPTVTEVFTPADMTFAEQRAAIEAVIAGTKAATLSSQFRGSDGAGGLTFYPLDPDLRDGLILWGQVAALATLGRRAQGQIDWDGDLNPDVGAEIYINGVTFTFVSGTPANEFEIEIKSWGPDTIVEAAVVLNACSDARVAKADYAKQGFNALQIIHRSFAAVGNDFTIGIGSSPVVNAVVSGATLSGGLDAVQPHRTEWHHPDGFPHEFGLTNVDGDKVVLDAYSLINVVRNLAYFVDTVTSYARTQRLGALAAEAAEDAAELLTLWNDVNDPANWDPGSPPVWP